MKIEMGLGEEIKFELDDTPASYSARGCQVLLNAFMGVFPDPKWAAGHLERQ